MLTVELSMTVLYRQMLTIVFGDCNFYARRFDSARQNYARAVEIDPSLGDYSLYQEAFVRGLQKDYTGKIQIFKPFDSGLSRVSISG